MENMFRIDDVVSSVGSFEMVEHHQASAALTSPYDWRAPHWVPNPVPRGYDIVSPPWVRPEQAPMSFVGEYLRRFSPIGQTRAAI
jgi:hypothetical protein